MKTHFDEAIGAVPASTLDVDMLIARGRRGTAYRRMGMSAAGLGVVAAVVTVALSAGVLDGIVARGRPAPVGGPAASASSPAARPSPTTAPSRIAPGEPVKRIEARLSRGLHEVVAEQLAGRPYGMPTRPEPFRVKHVRREHGEQIGPGNLGSEHYEAQTMITLGSVEGRIWFVTGAAASGKDLSCEAWSDETCTVRTAANGDKVVRIEGRTASGNAQSRFLRVYVGKADGTTVMVDANNGMHEGRIGGTPVLTMDQLVTIATDARLNLRP